MWSQRKNMVVKIVNYEVWKCNKERIITGDWK